MVKYGKNQLNQIEVIKLLQGRNKVTFCAHDAGGAEVLSSFINKNSLTGSYLVSGPAQQIFAKKINDYEQCKLTEFDPDTKMLVSTTGTTDFEFNIMLQANAKNAEVFVLIDHWTNYKERLEREDLKIRPKAILVVDENALEIAKLTYPEITIIQIENSFLANIKEDYLKIRNNEIHHDYLFISESRGQNSVIQDNLAGNNDKELSYFFQFLWETGQSQARILIRPHPSDLKKDYGSLIPKGFPNVRIDSGSDLLDSLSASKAIVGSTSMALVIADIVGKSVYLSIPDRNKLHGFNFKFKLLSEMDPS